MTPKIAIYIITNIVNAKQYVGITKNLSKRWFQHKSVNGSAPALHAAFKQYGMENFVFTHIADAFDLEAAKTLERLLIAEHNTRTPNGYNLTGGGQGADGASEETRQKMRDARLGKKMSNAAKQKLIEAKTGMPMHPDVKKKLLAANIGKKATEETRQKMSDAKKGKPPNSAGKPRSKEAIEKQRASIIATLAAKKAIQNAQKETV